MNECAVDTANYRVLVKVFIGYPRGLALFCTFEGDGESLGRCCLLATLKPLRACRILGTGDLISVGTFETVVAVCADEGGKNR